MAQLSQPTWYFVPGGGFLRDFVSPRSFLLRVSKAASACATNGSAAASSFSHTACFSLTSFAIAAHLSASTLADSFSALTFSFSTPTWDAQHQQRKSNANGSDSVKNHRCRSCAAAAKAMQQC
jgi:hypothetical protein